MLQGNPENQRGLSGLGIVIGLAVIGFLLTITLRILPVYMSNMTIQSSLKGLGENPQFPSMTKEEIISRLQKEFNINTISGPATKAIKVVRRSDGLLVNIDYEVRINFMGNLDVVMAFENQLNAADPESCCKKIIPDVKE